MDWKNSITCSGMTDKNIVNFVDSVRWIYAKTYPYAPHEYTLFEWELDRITEFRSFAAYITEHGGWKPLFNSRTWYFRFKNMKYWIMSPPMECTLINRTFIDDYITQRIQEYVCSPEFTFRKGMSLSDIVTLIEKI